MIEFNNTPLSLNTSLNPSNSNSNTPNYTPISSPSPSDEHPTNASPSNNSYIVKNLIDIISLNTQGNDNMAKILALSLSLDPRSLYCCNEVKQNIAHPFPRRINGEFLFSSIPDLTSKNGTCILVGSDLISHIHETFSENQYWCAIHLKFKPKIDLLITSIYLPHDKEEWKIATSSLIHFLNKHKQKHHILCGDFNSYPKYAPAFNAPTTYQKRKIYNYLQSWIDVAKATDQEKKYSHITKSSMARIDQI